MDLFAATTGEGWTNRTGWGSSRPVSEWYGVQWALGLSTRLAHRDASVLGTIVDLWRRGGRVIRLQIGMGVLLADPAGVRTLKA